MSSFDYFVCLVVVGNLGADHTAVVADSVLDTRVHLHVRLLVRLRDHFHDYRVHRRLLGHMGRIVVLCSFVDGTFGVVGLGIGLAHVGLVVFDTVEGIQVVDWT